MRDRQPTSRGAMALALALALALGAEAQSAADAAISIDEDELFGATVLRDYDPSVAAAQAAARAGARALPETVRIGGTSGFSSMSGTWRLSGGTLSPSAGSGTAYTNLYLDARPDDYNRFYLEGRIAYDKDSGLSAALNEAFAEASFEGSLRIRLGKQRVSWGVGYYYSPADVLSLEAIDLDDPTKKRAGPFAAKIDLPVGVQTLCLYGILPESLDFEALVLAPRAEFLMGGFEAMVAGYWRADGAVRPRLIAMATGAIGALDVFAESVLSWGADREWISLAEDGSLQWERDEERLYAQATAGLAWSWIHPEQTASLSLRAQYFYNGQGYSDSSVLREKAYRISKLVESGSLSASDLSLTGVHYMAASLGVGKLALDTVSLNLSAFANLSDLSFRLTPSASFKPVPTVSLKAGATISVGERGGEYAPRGLAVTPSLKGTYKDLASLEMSLPLSYAGSFSSGYLLDTVSLKATLGLTIPAF
jgi:hypothetical protein